MKKIFVSFLLFFSVCSAFAAHITGGEMYYTLQSQANGSYTYQVTLKLYRDCNSGGADLDPSAAISIYTNGSTHTSVWAQSVPLASRTRQNLSNPGPCIQNPPVVCYETGFYTFTVTLPGSPEGYTIAYQRCCRITGINNLVSSSTAGSTYTAIIPGTNRVTFPAAPANSSARFVGIDTVVTCAFNSFCYNFGAVDPDPGDSLAYSFSEAYLGGSQTTPAPNPPAPPSTTNGEYFSVFYAEPYSASQPLGEGVTLNPNTGLMCGVAPPPGIYCVTVSVREYRGGVLIATQRKDLQIKVGDCNIVQAVPAVFDINGIQVEPNGVSCRTFTYNFANNIPANPLVTSYNWEFSDGATYTTATPSHTFADTGRYTIKLVINRGQDCSDSLTTTIRIYPGFYTGFIQQGVCVNKTIQFTDTSRTVYGSVNSWRWDFGDAASTTDTSRLRNPTYIYPSAGTKSVTFIVRNSVGCVDTVRKDIEILTRPPLTLAFKDTLICNGDSVQLDAQGFGAFSWTPQTRIINPNTATPTVYPTSTTPYIVELNDQGCLAQDTVQVRVVDFVSVQGIPDTLICQGDTLRLSATTNGLRFLWDNPATLNDPTLLRPTARPVDNPTIYTITAYIGPRCFASDQVVVSLTPYSTVNAGNDTTICYNTTAQLNGTTNGTLLNWTPATGLTSANTLSPVATLRNTVSYVLSTANSIGCISRDTVTVKVNPEVIAFAGRDTAVVVGQPLQFNATGGEGYEWSPPTALSSTSIANPNAVYDGSFDSIRYFLTVTDSIGCADGASLLVKIFRTAPQVFVPTAFTPNGDGRNEFAVPVAVGLSKLDYFRIYNRWGQQVFQTTINGKGWDGRINGVPQPSSTFVWIVKGTDFTGKTVFEKGTVTLIR